MTPEEMATLHAVCFSVPRPWRSDEFADLVAQPGCFAATCPKGFALGRGLAGEVELLTLAVAPDARRRGWGRILLADFETASGAREAFLEVAADNHAARALYEAAGYAEVGRRRNYYIVSGARHIDALVFRKCLP